MTIEHKNIPDPSTSCHLPQGFTAAANATVISKSHVGAYEWVDHETLIKTHLADIAATAQITIGHTTDNATVTDLTALDTYYAVGGTWTDHHSDNITVDGATGKFTIDSDFDGDYIMQATISMISSRGNAVATFSFIKNGAYVVGTPRIRRMIGTGSDVGALAITTSFHGLVATDYLQIAVLGKTGEGWTAGDDVTVENGVVALTLIKPA